MNKATKGALAVVAATGLMVGGAGSLAYWSGTAGMPDAVIDSGTISFSALNCATGTGVHDWQFDNGDAFVPGTDKIVPGDTLTKVCDATLTLTGKHIGATLGLSSASFATGSNAALAGALSGASATFLVDGAAYAPITQPGTHTVRVSVSVPFPSTVTDSSTKAVSATLNAVTVTATQTHDVAP